MNILDEISETLEPLCNEDVNEKCVCTTAVQVEVKA